jgi:hypothetical protein
MIATRPRLLVLVLFYVFVGAAVGLAALVLYRIVSLLTGAMP